MIDAPELSQPEFLLKIYKVESKSSAQSLHRLSVKPRRDSTKLSKISNSSCTNNELLFNFHHSLYSSEELMPKSEIKVSEIEVPTGVYFKRPIDTTVDIENILINHEQLTKYVTDQIKEAQNNVNDRIPIHRIPTESSPKVSPKTHPRVLKTMSIM